MSYLKRVIRTHKKKGVGPRKRAEATVTIKEKKKMVWRQVTRRKKERNHRSAKTIRKKRITGEGNLNAKKNTSRRRLAAKRGQFGESQKNGDRAGKKKSALKKSGGRRFASKRRRKVAEGKSAAVGGEEERRLEVPILGRCEGVTR